VFRPITDANTRVAEMLAGGIDMMVEVPPTALSEFQGDDFTIVEQAGPHLWFLILNAKEGPFADVRVRQAANYAINKEAIVNDVLEGTADVAAGPTPPAFAWAYNEELEPYPYDPDRARALLAEAGAEGAELTFYVTEGGSGMLDPVPMGTAIQADLDAVGFDVRIETYEWNTFLGEVNPGLEGKADMAEMAWMTNDPDTLPFLALRTAAWPDQGGFNSGYYSNPRGRRTARGRTGRHRSGRARASLQGDAGDRSGRCALGVRRQLEAECGDQRPGRELPAGAVLPAAVAGCGEELIATGAAALSGQGLKGPWPCAAGGMCGTPLRNGVRAAAQRGSVNRFTSVAPTIQMPNISVMVVPAGQAPPTNPAIPATTPSPPTTPCNSRRLFRKSMRRRPPPQNIPFGLALSAGIVCNTSQCSTIRPRPSSRKMSMPA
jgi:hypothetical protein